MDFPEIEFKISSLQSLPPLLKQIKQCISDGTLKQTHTAADPFVVDNVFEVPDEGPWPDYIEAYFEDQKGKHYKLSIETYHGTGGTWGPLERA